LSTRLIEKSRLEDVMKSSLRIAALVALVATLLAACGLPVSPTPVPTLTAPASLPTPPTADIPESSCIVDEDCTYAFRLDRCCDCGAIYSRRYVDAESSLLLYRERWDYDYPVPRVTPADCSGINCAPCPGPQFGPICANDTCKAPEKWDEVSRLCPKEADPRATKSCYTQAAIYAYLQVGLDRSLELCGRIQGEASEGIPGSEECAAQIGRLVLNKDPDRAVEFCLDHLQQFKSRCLKEAGETIAVPDVDRGLDICEMIVVTTDGDRFQRDACFHNIAMRVRETDAARARAICEQMSERVDRCKKSTEQRGD
jgi:hypothetical protein